MQTRELERHVSSGWPWLAGVILMFPGAGAIIAIGAITKLVPIVVIGVLAILVWMVLLAGFFAIEPNQAVVLNLFGRYVGTVRTTGFHWANPFYSKRKISLRARNFDMRPIKVNDERGNPIDIAAVIVWRVADTARAVFDVDDFEHYVTVQSEAALRNLASHYPYDSDDPSVLSLRGSRDEVSQKLQHELEQRIDRAGVVIEEARLSYLAYAQEIAGAMLQRQQAEAIVAARTRIVDGAVGIVEMALEKLEGHRMLEMDPRQRAQMVNNLLVVLCGDRNAHPIVNAGAGQGGV